MPSRILVLEPDPTRQVALRAALASAGHTSRTVATGVEAADQLRAEPFGLVLLGPGINSAAAQVLRDAGNAPPIVKLAILPDCVIGEQLPGGGKASSDLPAILEALTRYMRFAPPREPGTPAQQQELLQDWAEYDRLSEG